MGKNARVLIFAVVSALLLMPGVFGAASASGHGSKRPVKKGILLVAFGTSEKSASVSFVNIESAARSSLPGVEIRWAYTSKIIREKLAREEGKVLLSPEEALARMTAQGFTHVVVQSLHTIPGEEFHDLVQKARRFEGMKDGFERVLVGRPLLSSTEDVMRTADTILKVMPKKRGQNEAVLLMGHGSHHPANVYYSGLNYILQRKDPGVMVGTVEGWPGIDEVLAWAKKKGITKAYLMPFMSVAGDHAKNDMAGPEDDSWKSILEKAGIECVPVLKGTAEYDEFVSIWVEHLKVAFGHFQ